MLTAVRLPTDLPDPGGVDHGRSSSVLGQDVDGDSGFLDTDETSAVLLDRMARAGYLSGLGLAAELGHEFVELPEPGGTDRVPFGLQATGRVDGDAAADGEVPPLGAGTPLSRGGQTEVLGLDDLAHRGGVVHLGNVHVAL